MKSLSPSPPPNNREGCATCRYCRMDASFVPVMEEMLNGYHQLVSNLEKENSELKKIQKELAKENSELRKKQKEIMDQLSIVEEQKQQISQSPIQPSFPSNKFEESAHIEDNSDQNVNKRNSSVTIIPSHQEDAIENCTPDDATKEQTKVIHIISSQDENSDKIDTSKDVIEQNTNLQEEINVLKSLKESLDQQYKHKIMHVYKLEAFVMDQAKDYEKSIEKKDEYIKKLKEKLSQLSSMVTEKAISGKGTILTLGTLLNLEGINHDLASLKRNSNSKLSDQTLLKENIDPKSEDLEIPPEKQKKISSLMKSRKQTFTSIFHILKEIQCDLDVIMSDPDLVVLADKKSKIFTVLIEMNSTLKNLNTEIKTVEANVEIEVFQLVEELKIVNKSRKEAQQAVTKHAALLEEAKEFVLAKSNSDPTNDHKIKELEKKTISLEKALERKTKVFSDTLIEMEIVLSKKLKTDFKFGIDPDKL